MQEKKHIFAKKSVDITEKQSSNLSKRHKCCWGRRTPMGEGRFLNLKRTAERPFFRCILDDQPDYLVPARLLSPIPGQNQSLIVNPDCWFSWTESPQPQEVVDGRKYVGRFDFGEGEVWVWDPGTHTLDPFGVGLTYRAILDKLRAGAPFSPELPPEILAVLADALVLVDPVWISRRAGDWHNIVSFANADFRRGYVTLEGLINPFHLAH